MKPVLILSLTLLSAPAFSEYRPDALDEAWETHTKLLEGQSAKQATTKLAKESFSRFVNQFCSTMRDKREVDACQAGVSQGGAVLIQQITEMMDSPPEEAAATDNGKAANNGLLSASSTCTDQAVIDEALRVGNANIKPELANGLKITRMENSEPIPNMVQEGVKYCRMTAVFNNGMTDGALVGIATPKNGKTQIVVLPNDGGH